MHIKEKLQQKYSIQNELNTRRNTPSRSFNAKSIVENSQVTELICNSIYGNTTKILPKKQEIKIKSNAIEVSENELRSLQVDTQAKVDKLIDAYKEDYATTLNYLKNEGQRLKSEYESSVSELESNYSRNRTEIREAIEKAKELQIQTSKENFDNKMKEIAITRKIITKIIATFDIKGNANLSGTTLDYKKLSQEKIRELAIQCAQQLNVIDGFKDEENSSYNKIKDTLADIENKKSDTVKNVVKGGAIAAAPIMSIAGVFKIAKGFGDIHESTLARKQIETDILKLNYLINKLYLKTQDTYEEPDVSYIDKEGEESLNQLDIDFNHNITKLENDYIDSIEDIKQREQNMTKTLRQNKEDLDQQILEIKKSANIKAMTINQNILNYKHDINIIKEDIVERFNQLTQRKYDIVQLSKELSEIKSEIDSVVEYKQIKSFELHKMEDLTSDDPFVIGMYKYDDELRLNILKMEGKYEALGVLDDLENYESSLKDKLQDTYEKISSYYYQTTKNLIMGTAVDDSVQKLECEEPTETPYDNDSVLFIYRDSDEEDIIANHIKSIVQNILKMKHPESILVNIIDPSFSGTFNNLQVDLTTIVNDEEVKGRPFVTLYSSDSDIKDVAEDLKVNLDLRYKGELSQNDYAETLKKRVERNAKIQPMVINILHRYPLAGDFAIFTENSRKTGIVNFAMCEYIDLFKNSQGVWEFDESKRKIVNKYKYIVEVVKNSIQCDTATFACSDKNETTFFKYKAKAKEDLYQDTQEIKDVALHIKKGFNTTDDFLKALFPTGEYWTYSADTEIKLYFGPKEGDMSMLEPTIIDENIHPHMFFAGITGAGKSVTLAFMENVLKFCYSPKEVEIWHLDFKIVEVGLHAAPYKTPHATALCGTTNPDYIKSISKAILAEMHRRLDIFRSVGVEKLSEYRKYQRDLKEKLIKQGKKEEADKIELMTRIVVIIDEAAQGLSDEDMTMVEIYRNMLIKMSQLSRAAGMHLIIITQTAEKIPSELGDNLAVRGCTRATPNVAQSVMKNRVCSDPSNQVMGFFGTTYDTTGRVEAVRKYIVPFNSKNMTKRYDRILYQMSLDQNCYRDAVVFNDRDIYTQADFNRYCKQENPVFTGKNILIGVPCLFQYKFKLLEIDFTENAKDNLLLASVKTERLATLFNQIYWCISQKDAKIVPIFCKGIPEYFDLEKFLKSDPKAQFCAPKGSYPEYLANLGGVTRVFQFFDGDMYTDKTKSNYKSNIWTMIESAANANQQKKSAGEYYRPIYFIFFDLEFAKPLLTGYWVWSMIEKSVSSIGTSDVHAIFVTSSTGIYTGRSLASHIVTTLPGNVAELPKEYKNIPSNMCKYINVNQPDKNLTFKPIIKEGKYQDAFSSEFKS